MVLDDDDPRDLDDLWDDISRDDDISPNPDLHHDDDEPLNVQIFTKHEAALSSFCMLVMFATSSGSDSRR